MFRRQQLGWIGVDVGARTVKLAQIERTGSSFRLSSAVLLHRNGPRQASDRPADDADGCDEIRCALSLQPSLRGRRAAGVLPMEITDLRSLHLPPGDDHERRTMIASELALHLQGAAEEYEFDFWDCPPNDQAGSSNAPNVNVLAARRCMALRFGSQITHAGLYCEVLDGLPHTLTRALNLTTDPAGVVSVGVLDWGFRGATFCAVREGRPMFARYLRNCGVGDLADRVAKVFSLRLEEAESLLSSHGLPNATETDPTTREVQEVIAEVGAQTIGELVEQLDRTISYLDAQRPRFHVEQVWLHGGAATIRNISAVLSSRIRLPVQVWEFTGGAGIAAKANAPVVMFGNAMALSMLAWKK